MIVNSVSNVRQTRLSICEVIFPFESICDELAIQRDSEQHKVLNMIKQFAFVSLIRTTNLEMINDANRMCGFE